MPAGCVRGPNTTPDVHTVTNLTLGWSLGSA